MIQAGRWYLHKVAMIPGTNFVIWRKYLEEAGRWDEQALTEDSELALRLLEKGYLISFNPLAITWEQEPQSWRVWYRQRLRWLQGNQYIVRKYFSWLFKGWRSCRVIIYMIGIYAALLISIILSDILFLTGLFHLTAIRVSGPLFLCWAFAFILFIMTLYLTLSFEESRENTPRNLWVIVLMYFIYSQCWVALGIRSWFLPLERWKKGPFWAKTVRVKLTP
jgi:cellulose synthase/poly-beta-1,6-N-acetylglucosamine synthase-like glycosyltransferase